MLILLIDMEVFALTKMGNIAAAVQVMTSILGFIVFFFRLDLFLKHIFLIPFAFVGLAFLASFTSQQIFGQDLTSGLIANIKLFAVGDIFLIYYLIKRGQIGSEELIQSLIYVGIGLFIIYVLLSVLNINVLNREGTAEDIEKTRKTFINLVSILVLTRFFNRGNYYYLFLGVILFASNHFGDIQRMVLVVFVITLLILFLIYRQRFTGVKFLMAIAIFLPMVVYLLFSTSDVGTKLQGKFSSVFALFEDNSEEKVTDNSILARYQEIEYANKWIDKHPFTGVGKIRSGSKTEFIGDTYFYASDIGLIGLWYTYGIPGIAIFGFFIILLIFYRNKLTDQTRGFWIFGIFICLYSIFTGYCIYNPMAFLFPLLIIFFYRHERASTTDYTSALQ